MKINLIKDLNNIIFSIIDGNITSPKNKIRIISHIYILQSICNINTIVLGQSCYNHENLPDIASAFSYNESEVDIPPSVSILAKILINGNKEELISSLIGLINDPIFQVDNGIIFINTSYNKDPSSNDTCIHMIHTVSFLRSLLINKNKSMSLPVSIISFGKNALRCSSMIRGSLVPDGYNLKFMHFPHPALASRSTNTATEMLDSKSLFNLLANLSRYYLNNKMNDKIKLELSKKVLQSINETSLLCSRNIIDIASKIEANINDKSINITILANSFIELCNTTNLALNNISSQSSLFINTIDNIKDNSNNNKLINRYTVGTAALGSAITGVSLYNNNRNSRSSFNNNNNNNNNNKEDNKEDYKENNIVIVEGVNETEDEYSSDSNNNNKLISSSSSSNEKDNTVVSIYEDDDDNIDNKDNTKIIKSVIDYGGVYEESDNSNGDNNNNDNDNVSNAFFDKLRISDESREYSEQNIISLDSGDVLCPINSNATVDLLFDVSEEEEDSGRIYSTTNNTFEKIAEIKEEEKVVDNNNNSNTLGNILGKKIIDSINSINNNKAKYILSNLNTNIDDLVENNLVNNIIENLKRHRATGYAEDLIIKSIIKYLL